MNLPPQRCPVLGCREPRDSCDKHKKKEGGGGKDHGYYNLKAWKQIRTAHLSAHPLCVRCLCFDITTPADSVDHVIPHRGDMELFLDTTNLQSLCRSCHSYKTNREARGHHDDYRV